MVMNFPDICECCHRKLEPMEVPIEMLSLSVRAYNCLKTEGIKTVGQLLAYSVRDILSIKNAGPKTAVDIAGALDDYGLTLPVEDAPSVLERRKQQDFAHDVHHWGYVTETTRNRYAET